MKRREARVRGKRDGVRRKELWAEGGVFGNEDEGHMKR